MLIGLLEKLNFGTLAAQGEAVRIDPISSLQDILQKAEPNPKYGYRGDLPKNDPLAFRLRKLLSDDPDLLERSAARLNDIELVKIVALLSLNLPQHSAPDLDTTDLKEEQQTSWDLLQKFIPLLIRYRGGAAEFIVLVRQSGELPNFLIGQFFPTQKSNRDDRSWVEHSLANFRSATFRE